jgi:ribosomal protein S18 acetylase RimI-like enzyme
MYQLRPAVPSDLPYLVQFNQALAQETEGKILDPQVLTPGIARLFAQPEYGFYTVIEVEGDIVACALITYEWSDWRNGPIWWLQSVYVSIAHRRQGLFRRLYGHLRKVAQAQGAPALRLYVDRDNNAAQQTYRSLGMHASHYDLYEETLP